MARKRTVNIRDLQDQAAAANAAEAAEEESGVKKKVKKKRKAAKRKSRAKAAADVRMKLYWGVFNQSLKRIALYPFDQKEAAEEKAEDLNKPGKAHHFVQKVKQEVVEE
ncbi:MAG: hypothetical protein NXI22_09525 [bacterium]|nr:hypothetical protein [bacterium]